MGINYCSSRLILIKCLNENIEAPSLCLIEVFESSSNEIKVFYKE